MNTVITCHANADFDAFAALIGASLLYPDAVLLFPGTQESNLQRYINDIAKQNYSLISPKEFNPQGITRAIILDTCQASRLNHIQMLLNRDDIEVIIYDHHPETDEDIQPNILYKQEIGATSSLITFDLWKKNIIPSSQDACLLFLGIHVDTGSFTYASTTNEDFQAAAFLWQQGIESTSLSNYLKTDTTPAHIKALNELLETTELHTIEDVTIAIAYTATEDYLHDFAMLAPKYMEIQPCDVFFAFASMKGKTQILARSTENSLDVGKVCAALGGGGHYYAASATIKNMTMSELKDSLFKEIYLQINPHKTAGQLLSSPVIGIDEEQTMGDAATLMARYGFKAIPVFKENSRICIGWITAEHAARGTALNKETTNSPVSIYMQRNFQAVSADASLQVLMDIIVGAKQRLVPVVAQKGTEEEMKNAPLIGVITRTDLIRLFSDENTILPTPTKQKEAKERNLKQTLNTRVPEDCREILILAGELANEMGFQISVVGGFVRDLLLEHKTKGWPELDVDLVVEGDGMLFAAALAEKLNGRVRRHDLFLTSMVIFTNKNNIECKIDVATARLEYYERPAALPTVEVSSLKMDLYRRDFSINSMAIRLNPQSYGILVDFFSGQNDIRNKKIRMLHTLSFVEDPTRILRAIRFEQRYNFTIGVQCARLMQNSIDSKLIDKLTGIRITGELELILKEDNTYLIIHRMEEFNLLTAIHPMLKLDQTKEEFVKSVLETCEWHKKLYLPEEIDPLLLLLLSLTRNASAVELASLLKRFDFIEKRRDTFLQIRANIIANLPGLERWNKNDGKVSELCDLLHDMPTEAILYCMARTHEEKLHKSLSLYIYKWQHEKADITGKDIKELGITQGTIYRKLLKIALDAKRDGTAIGREAQLELVKNMLNQQENSI